MNGTLGMKIPEALPEYQHHPAQNPSHEPCIHIISAHTL